MSLYQEPDGTRRLLSYLLDNLAGAIKRSESPLSLAVLRLEQEKIRLIRIYRWGHCESKHNDLPNSFNNCLSNLVEFIR